MRRFLVAVLVLFVAVILALWAVVTYRNHQSYNHGLVDARATRVIKVNVGALTRTIGWNVFLNPSFYADGESSEVMEKRTMANTGLATTANAFLFQMDDGPAWSNTTFGVLRLSDAEVFTEFLHTALGLTMETDSLGAYGSSNRLAVRYDDEQAFFALGRWFPGRTQADSASLMDRLTAYIEGASLIPVKESSFSEVVNQSGHLVVAGDERVSVDFLAGEIVFSYAEEEDWAVLTEPVDIPVVEDSAFVRVHGPIADYLPVGQSITMGNRTLKSDSLRSLTKGQIVGEWTGMAIQMDSVIAWEYDENFELEEVVELVERAIPNFYLAIETETDALQHYLIRQGVLDSVTAELDPDFFPVFPVSWKQKDGWLTLYTEGQLPFELTDYTKEPSALYVEADIQAIRNYIPIPNIHRQMLPFQSVVIKTDETAGGNALLGHIKMTDNTINSLIQLVVGQDQAN